MEGSGGLAFTWDPLSRAWLKERGPADAAPPPAEPIDDRAIQTYYLNVDNGHWEPTILGLRARQIAGTMGSGYRTAMMPGLAYLPPKQTTLADRVEDPEARDRAKQRGMLRFVAALLVIVTAIGGGAVAANSFLAPKPDATPSTAPTAAAVASDAAVTATTPATTDAPASTNAPAATQAPARTQAPVRTAVPTVAPVQIVTFSTVLSNGTRITMTAPNSVVQGTGWDATIRVVNAAGQGVNDNLTVFVGQLGIAQAVTVNSGVQAGVYSATLKITLPLGDQPVSVRLGNKGETRTVGTISVR